MGFKVGQKVVCINAKSPTRDYVSPLVEGAIYTIAGIEIDDGLYLKEAEVPIPFRSFDETRFRPLVSTNIDVFKAILANPHKQLETVE